MTSRLDTPALRLASSLCAAPGAGWASSSHGDAPLAVPLHQRWYGTAHPEEVRRAWLDDLGSAQARVNLLGVPYAGGSYGISCSDSGPLGIRLALGEQLSGVRDLGDVRFLPGPPTDDMLSSHWLERIRAARFGDAAAAQPVSMLSVVTAIAEACAADASLLTLGGDHSVSAAAIQGLGYERLGLLHVDAHGDLSAGRDGLSLLHSSWVHAADRAVGFSAVAQVGVIDGSVLPGWLDGRGMRVEPGDVAAAAGPIMSFFVERGCEHVYVSVDIDALVESDAPATGLPGGAVPLAALVALLDDLAVRFDDHVGAVRCVGADVTEVAPTLSGLARWDGEPTCRSAALLTGRLARLLDRHNQDPT